MSTTIDGLTLITGGWRSHGSALRLAVAAGRHALQRAGERPQDVDLLVNAGLFHDRNLGEPALAPLIQDDMGVNPDDPHPGAKGTFSFDVANGGCGVLTALQIADGFLRSKTITTALLVASDADPGHGLAPDFPFAPAGGALVCRWSEDQRGLGPFRWHNQNDEGVAFRSTVGFEHGGNFLTVMEDPAFAEQVGHVATVAAIQALQAASVSADSIGLVVASPDRAAFTKVLSAETGIPDERIVTAGARLHTTAFVAALDLAERTGRLGEAGTVLFVCGSAGLTAGAALYRP